MSWENRLIRKGDLGTPVVEQTPVVWKGRLLLLETWQSHWDDGGPMENRQYHVRIRDEQTNEILSRFMHGFGFASAFVWEGRFYVFAARCVAGHPNHQYMSCSQDLLAWSEPKLLFEQQPGEHLNNQSVCYDGRRFVMVYEAANRSKPGLSYLKFAESEDLENWRQIPGAVFGGQRYAACPALRYVGGYYYMLYLEYLKPRWWFETCLTRSKDLIHWQPAPHNPVIAPDGDKSVHPDCYCLKYAGQSDETDTDLLFLDNETQMRRCPAKGRECNASDPDLVEWQGKTRVYFTGGCQHWGGLLQYAEFDGCMREFFESYYQ